MAEQTVLPQLPLSGSLVSALQGLMSADSGVMTRSPGRSDSGTPNNSFWSEDNRSRKYGLDSPRSQATKNTNMRGSSPFQSQPNTARGRQRNSPAPGKLQRSKSEDCIKCMLKVPHKKCEAHKYIRIGGGYRHSYWYIKLIMEEIERQRQWELIRLQRLEAIQEKEVKAIKTYIRTKSGRLVERMVFVSAEDYEKMQKGDKSLAEQLLKKYLSADDAKNLQSWDKEEQRAIKTYIRTKSGRRIEKLVYVSRSDYDAMQRGDIDSNTLLKKYVKTKKGERIEGWGEAEMKTIKTKVRTKSGRLIEKTIMVSKEDYDKLMKAGGGDPETMAKILGKYLPVGEGEKIESWEKEPKGAMKVIKTYVRTKSGRLIEKTALLTEEEYKQFQESGGNPDMLRKLLGLSKDEVVEDWEKASTVYDVSDDEGDKVQAGNRVIGKDGKVYEYCVDPVTGKKYKKRVTGAESDVDSGLGSMPTKHGGFAVGAKDIIDEELGADASPEARERYMRGGRRPGSTSDYSYRSVVSAGGTRHVTRRRKREDGTYSDEESYHSDQDVDGAKRRRDRRKQRKEKFEKGKRRTGSASDYSYRSVVSAGGTRHVKRRRKKADGTYSAEESYHSSQDEDGEQRRQKRRQKRKDVAKKAYKEGKRAKGSDSEYSYKSDVSAGGTRHVRRRRRRGDGTYSADESYHSSADEEGKARRQKRRLKRDQVEKKKAKAGKRMAGSDSEYSYRSVVSAGGTRHVKRKHKRADGTYSDSESYHSSADEEGAARRRRRRRDRKHAGSAHSYFSVVSEGGTRRVKRKKRHADGTYSASESYHSSDHDSWADVKTKIKKNNKKKNKQHGDDSDHSYFSETSVGGTKYRMRKKRIRDKDGKVIGHGNTEAYTSGSEFSDESSDDDNVDLSKMTEEEKKKYFEEKAKRKEAREKRRKEKYGDKYEEMAARREAKKKAQSMVSYEKGARRSLYPDDKTDNREPGLGHDDWSSKGKKKGKGGKDGNEADSESDEEYDPVTGKKKKKKKGKGDDSESEYETFVDEHGNVVTKKKKKKGKDGDSDSEYEFSYDKYGNKVMKKKEKKKKDGAEESDDGDYFEKGEDGKIRLKAGKRKIDLSKVTKEELIALGIDPNLSKQEITRLLKEKFGDSIRIENKGRKVGLKNVADYGSDAGTDDLADDSDLDTSTLRGMRRVHVMMRRGGQPMLDHMKKVIDLSKLRDEPQHPDERDASIDFLTHFQLVDPVKLEPYARAFVVEDEDMDAVITYKDSRIALEAIPSVGHISKKQMDYVFKVLGIDENTEMTFRMFAVVTALSERVTQMDTHCKHLLEMSNLMDIERKLELYRMMFYCNVSSYRDPNYITAESLRIELMAGGLSWDQQDYIMDKMMPNDYREVSFLDYLCYIPLFLSMHDNICTNPLDMSTSKYQTPRVEVQRDMNPLGYPLKKDSVFLQKQRVNALKKEADDLLSGKKPNKEVAKTALDMFNNKYQKLPSIIGK